MKHNRISRQSKAEVARPGDGEYGGGGGDRMNGLRTGGELSRVRRPSPPSPDHLSQSFSLPLAVIVRRTTIVDQPSGLPAIACRADNAQIDLYRASSSTTRMVGT